MERKQASEYPQELLDLFHEYQHGEITRRDFLDRAAKFAVGGLTAAAMLREPQAQLRVGPAGPEGRHAHHGRLRTVPVAAGQRHDQGLPRVARPTRRGKLPAVLVIHENRGLNPYIEDVARRLARRSASSPSRRTASRRSAAIRATTRRARRAFRTVDGPKMIEDFVAAAHWLKARAGRDRQARRGRLLLRRRDRRTSSRCGCPSSAPRCRSTAASRAPRTCRRSRRRSSLHYAGNDQRINAGMAGLRGGAQGEGKVYTSCTCTRAPTTASTTTRRRATTRRPRSSPGSARSTSSTGPFGSVQTTASGGRALDRRGKGPAPTRCPGDARQDPRAFGGRAIGRETGRRSDSGWRR